MSVLDAPVPPLVAESAFGAEGRAELSGPGWSA